MSDTQDIKDKIDVVDLISEYVQLKPAGINHKGLCPFHNEKTPSFMANRERQSWHCFGCSKGGDIFTFVQEIEGMDFVEALRHLADKAGVTLSRQPSQENSSQKNRLKEINQEAARFYHNFLTKMDQSADALAYLRGRGLTDETIQNWQIGFVPDQWDLLTKYLLKKGFSIDDLVAAGLTIQREGADKNSGRGFYDRFRGRIMFPIRDVHGSVVGFTGRVLVETEQSGGKYVNTPQTAVYDKSRIVFGLSKAKQEIRKKGYIVMVEGQMDVIASHQAGMTNVVATSGTAMTEHQVSLLKRYATNMAMAFDADEAGVKAARRGIRLAVADGMHVKVIQIPEGAGADPDECIQKDSAVWKSAVGAARDVMDWYFSQTFSKSDLSNPRGKQSAVDALLPEIKRIPFAVEQDHWLRELASRVGVDVGVLRDDLKRVPTEKTPEPIRQQKAEEQAPAAPGPVAMTRLDLLIERYITLLLRLAPNEYTFPAASLDPIFSTSRHLPLYKAIKAQYTSPTSTLDIEALRNHASSEETENIVDVLLMKGELDFAHLSGDKLTSEVEKGATLVIDEWKKHRRKALQLAITEAEKQGNKEKAMKLLEQFQAL